MVIKFNTPKLHGESMTAQDYQRIMKVLEDLNTLGFHLWLQFYGDGCCEKFAVLTPSDLAHPESKSPRDVCCYDLYFLNVNFKS